MFFPLWRSFGPGWSRAFLPSVRPVLSPPSPFVRFFLSVLSVLSVVWAVLAPLVCLCRFSGCFLGCDPVIVAFRVDGFMYGARTLSYQDTGCAFGGCETDFVGPVLFPVFVVGDPRPPDFEGFVFFSVTSLPEAGSIVLSRVIPCGLSPRRLLSRQLPH